MYKHGGFVLAWRPALPQLLVPSNPGVTEDKAEYKETEELTGILLLPCELTDGSPSLCLRKGLPKWGAQRLRSPAAYGDSQARGPIGAAAARLCHSHTATQDPSRVCKVHHSSQQCQILNSLSGTRAWTCILKDSSLVHYCWASTGTPDYNLVLCVSSAAVVELAPIGFNFSVNVL